LIAERALSYNKPLVGSSTTRYDDSKEIPGEYFRSPSQEEKKKMAKMFTLLSAIHARHIRLAVCFS